jgi:hypothetical protein
MADHSLIAAFRQDLSARLPADVAEEVADGLTDAYEQNLCIGMSPETAATAALAEFGDPDLVVDAFRRTSPARRLARALIATGPVVGGLWAAALITSRAWDWPIPIGARLVAGPLVAVSVALLVTAVLTRHYQAVRRAGMAGCLGVAVLDASMVATVMVLAPAGRWLFLVAASVSAARLTFVAGAMRRMLAQPGV